MKGVRRPARARRRGSDRPSVSEPRWILLIHQLPPRPAYLRAKVRNRLEGAGALPLKNSVYILPDRPECLEDLQWIAQEAAAAGGEAWVCEADFSFGLDAGEIARRFRRARETDFAEIAGEVREASRNFRRLRSSKGEVGSEAGARLARLEKKLHDAEAIDYFGAAGRHGAELALESLKRLVLDRPPKAPSAPWIKRERLVGRTWVTRAGVQVDRIASAWLIRRFIDPDAKFRFVPAGKTRCGARELSFDMIGGDFSHEGDRCTFETLVARVGIEDPAVAQIGEIVHEMDLKDGKFSRADAPGVQQLLLGIVSAHADDAARLERGCALFDDLHRSFRSSIPATDPR